MNKLRKSSLNWSLSHISLLNDNDLFPRPFEIDILKNTLRFSIPDLGIKANEGRIPDYVAKRHKELREGEIWGVITLAYIPPEGKEKGAIELVDFKPFKPYEVDLEYFRNGGILHTVLRQMARE